MYSAFSFAFIYILKSKKYYFFRKSTRKKLNVLIIGLDSVSRLNFHRQMPLTLAFLQNKLEAIEFLGYYKVGDNTFPNLISILSGLNETELSKSCWHTTNDTFDNCNFLWNQYHEAGYATAFAEEAAAMGLFNYLKKGFTKQPVHHMWGIFNREIEKKIGHQGCNSSLCAGVRLLLEYLLEYTLKFVKSYKNQVFLMIT